VGGYLVGWRVSVAEAGRPVHVEGVFHLVGWSGTWIIDDVYFTGVNGEPLEGWAAF
jgi:hypothetical protein